MLSMCTCLCSCAPRVINPRRTCAARVTVVGSVCVSVTQHLTSRTFACLTISTTYSTGCEVRNFVWFSLKMLRCRARALPSLYGYALVGHFYSATCMRVCITIGVHVQYYTWCNRRIFDKTSRVCEMLFVLFIMPPSKVLYAHNVKLWYHQGNLCKGKSKT